MGILFCDGFDSYSATADLTKKWAAAASGWTWNSSTGRNGGGAIVGTTTANAHIQFAGLVNSRFCVGFYIKVSAPPASTGSICGNNNVGAVANFLRVNSSGALQECNSISSVIFTGVTNICDNNWHWVEWLQDHSTAGVNQCYVDGVQQWSGGNANLDAGTFGSIFELYVMSATTTITVDDIIIWDDSGVGGTHPSVSDFPLGPRLISTKRPTGDVAIGFATATGGSSHFNQVDEVAADGDTSYIESANSGDADLFSFGALGFTPSSINAVVSNAFVENPNPGTANFRHNAKSGTTTTNGSDTAVPTSYKIMQQSFPLDPNTGAAWASAADIDAANFGVEVR